MVEDDPEAVNKAAKARELYNEFNELLSKARTQLMSNEIILHDQMEVCINPKMYSPCYLFDKRI